MDTPNAPNPAYPNAQDQFVDVEQGQGGQNVPMQHPPQLAPAQPAPAGLIVPVP